jgi:dTDP-4-amino-4,6-dideoxygalactose transaminase
MILNFGKRKPLSLMGSGSSMQSSNQKNLIDFPIQFGTYQEQRLMRYPTLLSCSKARDKALSSMERTGFGASPIYPTILSNIEGANDHIKQSSPLHSATDFASRLITLPTHNAVRDFHISQIQKALQLND